MSQYDEIAAVLAELTDPLEIAKTLRGYSNRDVISVVAADVAEGGGGGSPDAVIRVVKVEGEWPERPDVNYVEWVGPGPAPPADVDNDTWVETGV